MKFKKGDLVLHNGQSSWMQPVPGPFGAYKRQDPIDHDVGDLYGIVLTVKGNKNGTVEVYWINGKFYHHYSGALKLIARANQ